jgi:hypothetical protein
VLQGWEEQPVPEQAGGILQSCQERPQSEHVSASGGGQDNSVTGIF